MTITKKELSKWYSKLGKKGAKKRNERLSPKRRSEIAKKAVEQRILKHHQKSKKGIK
jgi:hypothetical protein